MKKSIGILLILALILVAYGCNTDNGINSGNDSTSPPASQNDNDTATLQSDGDSGAAADNNTSDEDTPLSGDPQGNSNLYPIGTTATGEFANRYNVRHSVTMVVEEVIRGDAALSFINDEMMAAKTMWAAEAPDEEDQEYLVAKITYTLLAFDEDDIRTVTTCYAYSESFEEYPSLIAGMFYDKDNGYPQLSSMEVNVGETVTGYVIFQISKNDAAPVMSYCCNLADLSNGLWFKLS